MWGHFADVNSSECGSISNQQPTIFSKRSCHIVFLSELRWASSDLRWYPLSWTWRLRSSGTAQKQLLLLWDNKNLIYRQAEILLRLFSTVQQNLTLGNKWGRFFSFDIKLTIRTRNRILLHFIIENWTALDWFDDALLLKVWLLALQK